MAKLEETDAARLAFAFQILKGGNDVRNGLKLSTPTIVSQ